MKNIVFIREINIENMHEFKHVIYICIYIHTYTYICMDMNPDEYLKTRSCLGLATASADTTITCWDMNVFVRTFVGRAVTEIRTNIM